MRFILIVSTSLLTSACALAPQDPVSTPPQDNQPIKPTGSIHGISESDLVGRFGRPRLRVQEGQGTKLQWSANGCVLDAYLYSSRPGAEELVTHLDARTPSGGRIDVNDCLGLLSRT